MPVIEMDLFIKAPINRVFDLSRSIDVHMDSQSRYKEKAVAGVTSGLIELGQEVTWQATHFGIRQRLGVAIVAMDRPRHFRDAQRFGAFKSFEHDHFFEEHGEDTLLKDVFNYRSPLGILGHIADFVFLKRYMTGLLEERNQMIKAIAESSRWRNYLPNPDA